MIENLTKNIIVTGKHDRSFAFDLMLPKKKNNAPYPILIFAHGFKGFKDWGHWEQIGKSFTAKGYAFLKFNFAFNGVTIEQPFDFADLEAFGQNNFSKELEDVSAMLDWLTANANDYQLDQNNCTIIGHSRGGPIALLTAAKDDRIHKLISWAAVHELDYAWQDAAIMALWKKEGVRYIFNGRTKQQMPMYYQIVEDYNRNQTAFSVAAALTNFNKPYLIIHGDSDTAVPLHAARYLKKHSADAKLQIIEGGNHVFGGFHPFEGEELPIASRMLVAHCLNFLAGT